jgi:aerobic-type carbon monoxide dehydrogenase small subunit (CoxS/CutS family)
MHQTIRFTLNSTPVSIAVDRERPLLWVLRHDLALTGTKYGCGQGLCGSCTVLIDGIAVRSCQTTVGEAADREILTIEGLADGNDLHPVQQSFVEHDALQCGYCTPGMILQATSLLKRNPSPGRDEIIDAMENNLCRCGAHNRIIQAIEAAAEKLNGGG